MTIDSANEAIRVAMGFATTVYGAISSFDVRQVRKQTRGGWMIALKASTLFVTENCSVVLDPEGNVIRFERGRGAGG